MSQSFLKEGFKFQTENSYHTSTCVYIVLVTFIANSSSDSEFTTTSLNRLSLFSTAILLSIPNTLCSLFSWIVLQSHSKVANPPILHFCDLLNDVPEALDPI